MGERSYEFGPFAFDMHRRLLRKHGSHVALGQKCAVLLEALQTLASVSTYEARRDLDIYYPPARIKELRDDGYKIQTHWQIVTTDAGIDHRVGLYVLESGASHETA